MPRDHRASCFLCRVCFGDLAWFCIGALCCFLVLYLYFLSCAKARHHEGMSCKRNSSMEPREPKFYVRGHRRHSVDHLCFAKASPWLPIICVLHCPARPTLHYSAWHTIFCEPPRMLSSSLGIHTFNCDTLGTLDHLTGSKCLAPRTWTGGTQVLEVAATIRFRLSLY